jgi:hypothetical protein
MPVSPIFALGFANAALLYGLVATGVPIVIHLLNRRKHREVPWAAMRFLMAAIRKNRRRIRIEQWLLLAVRTLLVLLVVSALAKPFLESFGAVIAGRRTQRVIVLDDSLSMAYTSAEASRFDQAKTLASQVVKDSRRGDAISVILMGDPPRVVIGDPTQNLVEVKKEIDELTQSDGGTDLVATFGKVNEVLDASSIDQKEVVFLTDLQAASWRSPVQGKNEGLTRALARLEARRPRSVVIDLGKSGGENRAVTDLRLESPVVTVGSTVLIRAVLHNFGTNRADQVPVRLTADGLLGPQEIVDLPPGEDVPVVFRQQFTTAGDHQVEVAIDNDPLALDNKRSLVVPVREAISVLLIDGHFKSEPFQAETDYLAQALSPSEESPGQPSPMRVEVVSESQLSRRELAPYDVIVLCNVTQFTQSEAASLDDYLKQGGGVVIFDGDQVVPDNYNQVLYDDGKGLLPAKIGPSVGDASKREAAFGLNALGYRHPIVAEFQGESDPVLAGLTKALTYQYHKLELKPDSKARVALEFDTRDPAVIEMPRHRGTVFQIATSADTGWTDWPVHRSYVPVMQQIVLRASAGRISERNIRVGQSFDQSFPASGVAAQVTVKPPKGQPVTAKLQAAGGVSQFHFEQTDLSGFYQVKIGTPLATTSSFAANADPAESDLKKLDRAELKGLLPSWNFQYETNSKALTEDASSVGRRGELHRPLLYGVLILLLVESILAWKFGHNDS